MARRVPPFLFRPFIFLDMETRHAYIVKVESLACRHDVVFYMFECDTRLFIKQFSSLDELNVYADLHGYVIDEDPKYRHKQL